ncbi:MAG: rod-binding protein [Clostridium sp.]|nr:rod-binding protein [Acetatifactor muris]MCM1526761.1 rod-binding protein [Bacteroides sp.]MCM1562779.1 rod-binding protein [Clostridium sp.]
MDIGGLGSNYNDIYTTASNAVASKLEGQLKTDYSKATDDELMDVCKQFEAYFLEQVFKGMMKTIPQSEDSSSANSNLVDYFKDEMIQKVAADATDQSGLGLAQMLYEQMKINYGAGVDSPV